MTKSIFIYHDYAHHNAALWFALTRRYAGVRYVDANDILGGALNEKPAAFVMPGGASRYVADKLNGAGNAAIKDYVASGGAYIGICAGAYYACNTIYWQHGDQHIEAKNELAFFSGAAQGPIAEFCTGENTATITMTDTAVGRLPTFYLGGPRFFDVANSGATVLATYADLAVDNANVISGKHGAGRYLLTSAHPEYDHTALELMRFNVVDNRYSDIAALGDTSALTLDYFYTLTDAILE